MIESQTCLVSQYIVQTSERGKIRIRKREEGRVANSHFPGFQSTSNELNQACSQEVVDFWACHQGLHFGGGSLSRRAVRIGKLGFTILAKSETINHRFSVRTLRAGCMDTCLSGSREALRRNPAIFAE